MAVEMVMIVGVNNFGADKVLAPAAKPADYSNTAALGSVLYTDYLLAFELAAVVLLVAIVAAIALTLRSRKESKPTDANKQVAVKKADRLRIVKMAAVLEPKAEPTAITEEKK
jgi:NADH-quinone oxidoreductase subunit J